MTILMQKNHSPAVSSSSGCVHVDGRKADFSTLPCGGRAPTPSGVAVGRKGRDGVADRTTRGGGFHAKDGGGGEVARADAIGRGTGRAAEDALRKAVVATAVLAASRSYVAARQRATGASRSSSSSALALRKLVSETHTLVCSSLKLIN